jgi:galactoside O-acetyltransferase
MYDLSLLGYYGEDVYISPNVEIKRPKLVTIGNHIAIDSYFYVTTVLFLRDYIHIAPMVSIIGGASAFISIDDFCTIAAGCRLIGATDEYLGAGLISPLIPPRYRDTVVTKTIYLKRFSALASNVVVMPGVTLGEGAVVGANSYVNHDIPEWEIWAGSPARFIRKRPMGNMIKFGEELLNETK